MDYDEILMYLYRLERMGLVKKQYDPVTQELLWELTTKGKEAKHELGDTDT